MIGVCGLPWTRSQHPHTGETNGRQPIAQASG
jgi:hypothetical protein